MTKHLQPVSTSIDFPKEEERVLAQWSAGNIFRKSVEKDAPLGVFSFYDGPPFATGLPHYGHLLAGTLKDIVPRYWTMKGYRVERRFGWDCHGLPVEYEIDSTLGLQGRKAIEEYGIAKYNDACRGIVQRYTAEWEKTVARAGRWVDFKNNYRTMDADYMESVWWCFKQLWDKQLVYEGYKVMPYSWAIATPLSNFEAGLNYKDVQDPAITVAFTDEDDANLFYLAWTTTPWTLPSNLALAIGDEIPYARVKHKDGKRYVLAHSRVESTFPKAEDIEVEEVFSGAQLDGRRYQPLFPYFADRKTDGAFRIIVGAHVTDSDGTGIVHIAPGFGEEDFDACKQHNIAVVMPVDDDGKFTADVPEFFGRQVHDADRDIIRLLKERGQLFRHDTITHAVPFCWRSDTKLIYRAVSTWFIRVESFRERILEHVRTTHWVPENVRDGRFANWLANARDWAVSRNRFWGNPIPLWRNDETGNIICIGSRAELKKYSGQSPDDLHREFLDDITFALPNESGTYRRVSEVMDCWFESAAMPYAQQHYPFEKESEFQSSFPADFIAEGLDQTRGWFYTLSALGTALFDTVPYKNVIVNGMILAADGKKMSKRLKNYPDPQHILDTYGADALRLYLIHSPAVHAAELRFSEEGVKDIVRRVLLKWWNAYAFFANYAVIDSWTIPEPRYPEENTLDKWIISRLNSLLETIEQEMKLYCLHRVVPALLDFLDDLTNTYIRLNRKRFWSEAQSKDKDAAYYTLFSVLLTFTKAMAPFTPFLAETIYNNLQHLLSQTADSVHLEDYPVATKDKILPWQEDAMKRFQNIIEIGRALRESAKIKTKIPLKKITIIVPKKMQLETQMRFQEFGLENYIREELNVRQIQYSGDESHFIKITAKPNGATLGPRLGTKFGQIGKAISALDREQIAHLESGKPLIIQNESITIADVKIHRDVILGNGSVASNAAITIALDVSVDEDQQLEGLAREILGNIQKLRKTAGLKLDDRIIVEYSATPIAARAIDTHRAYICEQALAKELKSSPTPQGQAVEELEVDGERMSLGVRAL